MSVLSVLSISADQLKIDHHLHLIEQALIRRAAETPEN